MHVAMKGIDMVVRQPTRFNERGSEIHVTLKHTLLV